MLLMEIQKTRLFSIMADVISVTLAYRTLTERLLMLCLQLTSQDHTPEVIQSALKKHNMDVSCHDFSLWQMLHSGKGQYLL